MPKKLKILATIAARGGSKGVKNKNIRPLLGKPLIAYSIKQLLRWGKFDRFIVSTDSPNIAAVARRYAAEVPFLRPARLATDTACKLDALRYTLVQAERYYNTRFDVLFDLDATAPIRTLRDMDNIVNLFKKKRPDCVFSVVKARRNPYFNMVEVQADGACKICKKLPASVVRRQDAPGVYEMNASMYVYGRKFLMDAKNKLPYSGRAFVYKMNELSSFDIDSEMDFKFIEFLAREGLVKL